MIALLFASLILMPRLQDAPPKRAGVIEGSVVRFGTSEGLASVRIYFTREGQTEINLEPDAVTDGSGHFQIQNALPGSYVIHALRSGYSAPLENGMERETGGDKAKITVDLRNPLRVDLALVSSAVLAGTVHDPSGKPTGSARVEATRLDKYGGRESAGSVQTNDQGEFRIWGLDPGRYLISVEYRTVRGAFSIPQDSWFKTYYPGTADPGKAAVLEVAESSVTDRIDFGFQTGEAFKITGNIINSSLDNRPGGPDFYLIPLDAAPAIPEMPRLSPNLANVKDRVTGAFELHGVRSGKYILFAQDWKISPNYYADFVVSQTLLDVHSDISGLSLTMSGTGTIEGVVQNANKKALANATVVLIPSAEQRNHPMFYKTARSDASGGYSIKGVLPGEYTLYAVDPEDFKDDKPPASLYAMPPFLAPYAAQGVSIHVSAEDRVRIPISPIHKQ